MIAHLAKVAGYLAAVLATMEIAADDMRARLRAEKELSNANATLELRIEERTEALVSTNRKLEEEAVLRRAAEGQVRAKLERLNCCIRSPMRLESDRSCGASSKSSCGAWRRSSR